MKVIDGNGLLLGRIGSYAAKAALLGEEVKIVNAEKVVISGTPQLVFAREKQKRDRIGYPLKSAKHPRLPDRYLRRAVRGMLPHKKGRGKEAFKRILCYVGVPAEFAGKEKTIKDAQAKKLPTLKYTTVGEVCYWLRGKK